MHTIVTTAMEAVTVIEEIDATAVAKAESNALQAVVVVDGAFPRFAFGPSEIIDRWGVEAVHAKSNTPPVKPSGTSARETPSFFGKHLLFVSWGTLIPSASAVNTSIPVQPPDA